MAASPRSPERRPGELLAPMAAAALPRDPVHLARIEQSHLRCATQGLSRIELADLSPLDNAELALRRERHRRLYTHAAPVMDLLREQIVDTQSMVVLTDAQGTILHAVGDDDFLQRASKVALAPGVNWSEHSKGTNAIGTALVDELPTLVHADEHYLHANHFLTCSASPIVDPRGNVLGVLDVTGDHRSYHRHTMGLVKMSVRMIENHWLADDFRHGLRLHFHTKAEYLGTLMEGIVAVAEDGRCLGANRAALQLLQLGALALRMHPVEALFGLTVGEAIGLARRPLPMPTCIVRPGGSVLHLQCHYEPAAMHALESIEPAQARASKPPAVTHEPRRPMLDEFDTGDPQMHALMHQLRQLLGSDMPLLIQGETGTGKAWLAQAVHAASSRTLGPWVVVHCAAQPAATLERELFGSAEAPGVGALARASGGTLLLDDVDALPLPLQARLVHELDDEATRHWIATTCSDLRSLVREGRFRDDLLFRLEGLSLRLPALRERSDVDTLARRIVELASPGRPPALSAELIELLRRLPWPGNLHQLTHALKVALRLAGDAGVLRPEHLPHAQLDEPPSVGTQPEPRTLHDLEQDGIRAALAAASGNVSEAARRLGVSRNTIYRRLRQP